MHDISISRTVSSGYQLSSDDSLITCEYVMDVTTWEIEFILYDATDKKELHNFICYVFLIFFFRRFFIHIVLTFFNFVPNTLLAELSV